MYVVKDRKAFRLVTNKYDMVGGVDLVYESQEHETQEAERICSSRHVFFLCRDFGLSSATAAIVTQYVTDVQPFIFAEPVDIWIDIRLSKEKIFRKKFC